VKALSLPAAFLALAVMTTGCGGPDRSALATQTVKAYWTDIAHMQLRQAYNMLTPGDQVARPFSSYTQDMMGFLSGVGGLQVRTGKPIVNSDVALVPVKLFSPKAPKPLPACQHLAWVNNHWLISDQNGGLSPPNTCRA